MKIIGITGQAGFIGWHLYNTLSLYSKKYALIHFEKTFFENEKELDQFVSNCDVIIHLAGVNRAQDQQQLFNDNIMLTEKLILSLERTRAKPHVIFSSSTQEEKESLYGNAKKIAREKIAEWALKSSSKFTGLVIPNVFGPFGKPYYNSVIATFCHQLVSGKIPNIDVDANLNLIYVGDLVKQIIDILDMGTCNPFHVINPNKIICVSAILHQLNSFKADYIDCGIIPKFNDAFDVQLFNTFRSFESLVDKYPVKYIKHSDVRGDFTELIKLNSGGQISFSTTHKGVTRGNHFHTRKIERFSVIKGEALIQLRKIGTDQVFDFKLSGDYSCYVDMPIWYTHNIKNIGSTELYTVFWINEFYDANDPDTFMEIV